MADENKISQNNSNTLSPQIKPPPVPTGGQIPANLPQINSAGSIIPPPQPSKIAPPSATPPKTILPNSATFPAKTSAPAATSIEPKPPVSVPMPDLPASVFRSSIRTMQDDMGSIKKGQAPSGFTIDRQSEMEVKQPQIQKQQPSQVPTSNINSNIELGRLERSRPLSGSGSSVVLPKQNEQQKNEAELIKPKVSVPASSGLDRLRSIKPIWLVLGIVAVVCVLLVLFVVPKIGSVPDVSLTPTPTEQISSTPKPVSDIETKFSPFSKVSSDINSSFFDNLLALVDKESLLPGEPGLYQLVDAQSGSNYLLGTFMNNAGIIVPEDINLSLSDNDFYASLVRGQDGNYSHGIIVKLDGESDVLQKMLAWESDLPSAFSPLFGLDLLKAGSTVFLDNTYQGAAIRYINFPDPLKTIDYSIVLGTDDNNYLVLTSSRDHMYKIILELVNP